MDIIQVKESIGGRNVRLDEAMDKLIQIYEFTGNKAQVGFLGNISNVGKDDLGNFEFNTEYSSGGLDSISTGVVLDDSAIIKQVQKSDSRNIEPSYQIYSWDTDTCDYVWIAFTNSDDEKKCKVAYTILPLISICHGFAFTLVGLFV